MHFCHLLFQLSTVLLPGNHVVMVLVANGLASLSANLNVSVLYPITIRHITANPVTLGRPFVLEAVMTGDLDIAVMVDFGDGDYINSSATMPHPDVIVSALSDSSRNGSAPVYLLKVQHLYATPDDYAVSLSVANKVSHVTNSLTADVGDKDFDVVLTADCQSPVASNLFVSLNASVSTSEDEVQFIWMCDRCSEAPLVHRSVMFIFISHYLINSLNK